MPMFICFVWSRGHSFGLCKLWAIQIDFYYTMSYCELSRADSDLSLNRWTQLFVTVIIVLFHKISYCKKLGCSTYFMFGIQVFFKLYPLLTNYIHSFIPITRKCTFFTTVDLRFNKEFKMTKYLRKLTVYILTTSHKTMHQIHLYGIWY